MPQSDDLFDADFDSQLQGLFEQAEKAMSHRAAPDTATVAPVPKSEEPAPAASESSGPTVRSDNAPASGPAFLKPLIQGMEAVLRAATENTVLLKKMETGGHAADEGGMPQLVADLRAIVEARNTVSQSMFSALHKELKDYKDGFLLQTVHRPIIRDLVSVYDDIAELHRQMGGVAAELTEHQQTTGTESPALERVRQIEKNMANNLDFLIEVLARLEVTTMLPGTDKLDKLTQRAVSVEAASDPSEDGSIVRSVKRGFMWKDAVLRPEEVVIRKWKRGSSGKEDGQAK